MFHPRSKLQTISARAKQLWVVAYVDQKWQKRLVEQALCDLESSFENGADSVVLINEWCSLKELETTLQEVRKKYPQVPLGVNYLGHQGETESYGYRDAFRLARDYKLQVVWTDFSGVDLIHERPAIDLHQIEAARPENVFYASGVHMKYSTLVDADKPIEKSALQAMGWVDGVIVTGPKTGAACNPDHAKRVRAAIGDYPLGVASGVSPSNVHEILPYVDFYLVASSLQDSEQRIDGIKVRALRTALDQ